MWAAKWRQCMQTVRICCIWIFRRASRIRASWASKHKNGRYSYLWQKPGTSCGYGLFWRRVRDSNSCWIAPKRFSRPPPYDHLGNPPCMIIQFLCGNHRFSRPPRYDHFATPPRCASEIIAHRAQKSNTLSRIYSLPAIIYRVL